MKKRMLISLFCCSVLCSLSFGQQVALKTNLLYDATTTPNLGIEIGMAPRQTFQLFYGINPWSFGHNKQFRHWVVQPEYRWWFCHRFNGSFIGAHLLGGQYNVGGVELPLGIWNNLKDYRYEGWGVGGGLTYGYQWIVTKHWNVEASIGVGYAYLKYKKFQCKDCGEKLADKDKHYVGPTKAAVSLIYLF